MNAIHCIRMIARAALLAAVLPVSAVSAPAVAAANATQPTHAANPALPAALRPVLYQSLARDAGSAYAIGKNGCAVLPKQQLKACFDNGGAHFSNAHTTPLALHLIAYGRSSTPTPIDPVRPVIAGNRVAYRHGPLTEWWRVLPVGFEQGFTVAKRPAGKGELTLVLASRIVAPAQAGARSKKSIPAQGRDTKSDWIPASAGMTNKHGTLTFGKLRYGQLVVTDANGKTVPSTLTTKAGEIRIAVNDARAAYPLTVDPLVWLEQKVTASDGADGDNFGYSVAVSGTTALVGAYLATVGGNDQQGAAYVFDDSGNTWTQTQKLTASDGAANDVFGGSVALAGTTALVGAYQADDTNGAAYVFGESGGTWTQSAELTASDGAAGDRFGYSVALSGATALVGANYATVGGNAAQGAAYVFTESGGTWTQSAKLTADDGASNDLFGWSVALAGTTPLIGAYDATVGGNSTQGAAYFYGQSDLALALSAPAAVDPGGQFVSQTLATNSSSAASPPVAVTVSVPAAASFVSATASQGTCGEAAGLVTCDFGAIAGNAGMATANVTLKAMGSHDATIENTASVSNAIPALTAAAPTAIDTTPVAQNGTLTTTVNTAASGTLIATDADGDPLTYAIDAQPANGTVTLDDAATGAYTYTPDTGYTGGDSFTFHANDGMLDSNVATVTITVKAGNACPNGYAEYDGTLAADQRSAVLATYVAPAGTTNAILIAPAGFLIQAAFRQAGSPSWQHYVTPGPVIHKHTTAGAFKWAVKAGASGGAYTLCLQHP